MDDDDEVQNVTSTTRGKSRGRGRGTGTRGGRGKTPSTRGRGKARGSKSQVVETTQKSIQSCKQNFSFCLMQDVTPFDLLSFCSFSQSVHYQKSLQERL